MEAFPSASGVAVTAIRRRVREGVFVAFPADFDVIWL